MSGGDLQRHCSECNKIVIALAEMSAEDAADLVRQAKPHSLCLRVEHDEAGAVIFRKPSPPSNSKPLLMLTVGASLLLNGCDEGSASPPAVNAEKNSAAQSMGQDKPSPLNSSALGKDVQVPADTLKAEAAPAASSASKPASSASDRPVKLHAGPTTRITTGCACRPGDTLCDCL